MTYWLKGNRFLSRDAEDRILDRLAERDLDFILSLSADPWRSSPLYRTMGRQTLSVFHRYTGRTLAEFLPAIGIASIDELRNRQLHGTECEQIFREEIVPRFLVHPAWRELGAEVSRSDDSRIEENIRRAYRWSQIVVNALTLWFVLEVTDWQEATLAEVLGKPEDMFHTVVMGTHAISLDTRDKLIEVVGETAWELAYAHAQDHSRESPVVGNLGFNVLATLGPEIHSDLTASDWFRIFDPGSADIVRGRYVGSIRDAFIGRLLFRLDFD